VPVLAAAAALCGLLVATGPTAAAGAPVSSAHRHCPAGLPSGIPPAACGRDPALPEPSHAVWPFPDTAWPYTEGSGRLAAGAFYWTDYVYDDHGALGNAQGNLTQEKVSALAPPHGSYLYPGFTTSSSAPKAQGPARGNGADIFRAGVGLTRSATYWRVDWNTLVSPTVPIAEWAFDRDDNAATGGSNWPANAGIRSPGIGEALLVSSRGAWLIDVATGRRTAVASVGGRLTVERAARSFVVRIPRSALPVSGRWRIRLAAGLANRAGTGFATVPTSDGRLPGETSNVYNVTFRRYSQEPPVYRPSAAAVAALPAAVRRRLASGAYPDGGASLPTAEYGNFWEEDDQAITLATGNVAKFSAVVDWARLAHHVTTPEPDPTGYTNRWYVSGLHLGQGVVPNNPKAQATGDLRPNYLGRVQPYAVYVPTGYRPGHPLPLTWILHSLSVNLNQYGAVAGDELRTECQDRDSICATTEGYGPDGWYFDEAELDFFRVWHAMAASYSLQPNRTALSGYSMGGFATFILGLTFPDLFNEAMALEGPPFCGARIVDGAGEPAGPGRCTNDSDTTRLVRNARWLPYIITSGAVDELVPVTSLVQQGLAFEKQQDRTIFAEFPAEDHMAFSVQNSWTEPVAQMSNPALTNQPAGVPRRTLNPPTITYTWYPNGQRPGWGVAPTGIYWVRGLTPRRAEPGELASVTATTAARPGRAVTTHLSVHPAAWASPSPAIVRSLLWTFGHRPAARRLITLKLVDVAATGIAMRRAGMTAGTVLVTTDGPTRLTLSQLPAGTPIRAGRQSRRASAAGRVTVSLSRGRTAVRVG
jgi:hypothetical protein